MPKNDNGKFVCINHADQELGENHYVVMPQMVLNGRSLEHSNESLPAKVKYCDVCGYMEFYTIRPDEDFPEGLENDLLQD